MTPNLQIEFLTWWEKSSEQIVENRIEIYLLEAEK